MRKELNRRLAILHGDRTLDVLAASADIAAAERDLALANMNEHDPAQRARLVVVEIAVVSIIDDLAVHRPGASRNE